MTKRVSFIELDIIKCTNVYGSAPCTASVGVTGSQKCFNCRNTCQDIDNITEAAETVRYSKPSTNIRFDLDATPNITVPNIASIAYTPPVLELGKSIGVRASLTVTFNDHRSPDTDAAGDQYLSDRSYDPYETGTYWGKFRARYPYLQGVELRWIQGTDEQQIADMETRVFTIENSTGPNSGGVYSITAKDILKITDGNRSQAPVAIDVEVPSGGITDTYTGNLFVGTGKQLLLPGGYAVFGGKEIVEYEDLGADPTNSNITILARGQLNTEASAHDEGDSIQQVLSYEGETPAYILNDLLVNYAGIDSAFVPINDWNLESSDYIGRTYTAHIGQPESVVTLINEVLEQSASTMWWDNQAQLIRWQVLKQPVVDSFVYSDNVVSRGTFNIADNYKARISRCWVFFGQLNPLLQLTEEQNYTTIVQREETQAEPFFDNKPAIKKIFSRWIASAGRDTAERLGDLILQRFNLPPRKVGFKIQRDSGINIPELGGSYNVENTFTQTETGELQQLPIQITSIVPGPTDYRVVAEEITYTQIITADPDTVPISIDTNQNNVNIRTLYDQIAPEPDADTVVNVSISTGVVVGSSDTGIPALVSGDWPAGATVNIVNNGYIVGRGGNGGNGGSSTWNSITEQATDGTDGGDAIELTYDVSIDNTNGIIGSGGGGGGGAGSAGANGTRSAEFPSGDWFLATASGGSGGGGGAGSVSGSGGNSGTSTIPTSGTGTYTSVSPTGGLAGSLEDAGAESTLAYRTHQKGSDSLTATTGDPLAGNGGDLGQAGTAGSDGQVSKVGTVGFNQYTGTGGGAGVAGYALVENGGSVTWVAMGDVRGSIV